MPPEKSNDTQQIIELQVLYFNGFQLTLSNSDVSGLLMLNGQPTAAMNMSFTTAKTLSIALNEMINTLEKVTGREIMTNKEIGQGINVINQQQEKKGVNQLQETFDAIADLMRLPVGWDYGNDGPATAAAATGARLVARLLSNLGADAVEILPGFEGGVTIVGVKDSKSAEITISNKGLFSLDHETNGEEDGAWQDITYGRLVTVLGELKWQSLRSYASCILSVTAESFVDIPVKRSADRVKIAASPSLIRSAWPLEVPPYAITSGDFIRKEFPVNHQSSGVSLSNSYQKVCRVEQKTSDLGDVWPSQYIWSQ